MNKEITLKENFNVTRRDEMYCIKNATHQNALPNDETSRLSAINPLTLPAI